MARLASMLCSVLFPRNQIDNAYAWNKAEVLRRRGWHWNRIVDCGFVVVAQTKCHRPHRTFSTASLTNCVQSKEACYSRHGHRTLLLECGAGGRTNADGERQIVMEYDMEHEFTVKFSLPNPDGHIDEIVGRLGEAGCDDALIGIGAPGRIALKFSREARSSEAAIASAIRDIQKAVPLAELLEVGPGFGRFP